MLCLRDNGEVEGPDMLRAHDADWQQRLVIAFAVFCTGLILAFEVAHAQMGLVQPRNVRTEETWASIRVDMVGDGEILDGSHLMTMETPIRSHDAALVPLKLIANPGSDIDKMTIVVDENPAPLAAVFRFGPASGNASISTRIRINSYSYVRVIAEPAMANAIWSRGLLRHRAVVPRQHQRIWKRHWRALEK